MSTALFDLSHTLMCYPLRKSSRHIFLWHLFNLLSSFFCIRIIIQCNVIENLNLHQTLIFYQKGISYQEDIYLYLTRKSEGNSSEFLENPKHIFNVHCYWINETTDVFKTFTRIQLYNIMLYALKLQLLNM